MSKKTIKILQIEALCAITWMFLSNFWGKESKEIRSRDTLAGRRVDWDKDGYPSTVDCNDRNASTTGGHGTEDINRHVARGLGR